jgi:RNA polymerase sigma-70 factor, ECF subfamily
MSSHPPAAAIASAPTGFTGVKPDSSATLDLESVFRENHAMVFRTAYYVTGNTADAEDAAQTVFLRLLNRGADADLLDNVGGYLHRSALNAARDVMRRRRRALLQVPLEDAESSAVAPQHSAPDSAHAAGEVRDWLRRALTRLGARTAEMFVMRFFEGKPNGEIARAMRTTPGTVAVALCRARGRLHEDFRAWSLGVETI